MSRNSWESKKVIDWKSVNLGRERIQISNVDSIIPVGLTCAPEFLTNGEASLLLTELDNYPWATEGFTQRRRIQRYDVRSKLPDGLGRLVTRFIALTTCNPKNITVEEYPIQPPVPSNSSAVATAFESLHEPPQLADHYFVAQVSLSSPTCQHMNRPKKRLPDCWKLQSTNHWIDIRMDPGTLFMKTNQALWDWRTRITRAGECDDDSRAVVLKFYALPEEDNEFTIDSPAVTPIQNLTEEFPSLGQILTIIVTTSPIKSHPSTEVMERTFGTFAFAGDDFLRCRKVIICDGVRVKDETGSISNKHANAKQALRNGIATTLQADNYNIFKKRLREICRDAADDSPFCNTHVEELPTRHGYGFALRHALNYCVSTRYVCVIQHDRTFMRPTPMKEAVKAMWHHPRVKYVGISMRSNLMYREIFISKYGKPAHDEFAKLILRPKELQVDASKFGPDSESVQKMAIPSAKLKANLESLKETYFLSAQCVGQRDWLMDNPLPPGLHQVTLTPTIFWYDNTHLADTLHYRDFIFNPRYKMVAKGGFVEDKTSPVIVKSVERFGLADGHEKFGCYLLDDHSGYFFTGHLDGGSYIPRAERKLQFGVTDG